jgi:hypothetical protein
MLGNFDLCLFFFVYLIDLICNVPVRQSVVETMSVKEPGMQAEPQNLMEIAILASYREFLLQRDMVQT